jgi:hypothetical protein
MIAKSDRAGENSQQLSSIHASSKRQQTTADNIVKPLLKNRKKPMLPIKKRAGASWEIMIRAS